MVEGGGFEPPKLARQIYSLIPLATREPLRRDFSANINHLSHIQGRHFMGIKRRVQSLNGLIALNFDQFDRATPLQMKFIKNQKLEQYQNRSAPSQL